MLLQEVQKMKNIDELEAFMLKHGENIVDMMGAEIDRIEMKLRVSTLTPLETQVFLSDTVKVLIIYSLASTVFNYKFNYKYNMNFKTLLQVVS
jgi:hypothetical protein